jgi:pimeloyl-ACP methyl ester carboxylesterase
MALGYFGVEQLPRHLCQIPIEPLARAISTFRSRADVAGRVALAGASKGGELALLLAAHFPHVVDVVVGVVPSGVSFMGIGGGPRSFRCFYRSSWTMQGKPLPFVRMRMTPDVLWKSTLSRAPMRIADIYVAAMANRDAVDAATIPVERFSGPVLLLSAADDGVWPSPQLSSIADDRLARRTGGDARHEHLTFEHAGHALGIPYDPSIIGVPHAYMGRTAVIGGTKEGTARASISAWDRGLAFLAEHLQPSDR